MYTALLVVLLISVSFGLLRLAGWLRRRRGLATLGEAPLVRVAHGVGIRIHLAGTRALHGLAPNRAHRGHGDLALTADRFLIGSTHGVLADLGPGHGRRFRSVRCTGPGRLVIEGEIPSPQGAPGLYRFDIVVDDAQAWAAALQPFVEVNETTARFATAPPVASPTPKSPPPAIS
jgi:hypothetical protein